MKLIGKDRMRSTSYSSTKSSTPFISKNLEAKQSQLISIRKSRLKVKTRMRIILIMMHL